LAIEQVGEIWVEALKTFEVEIVEKNKTENGKERYRSEPGCRWW
jgi:hypothetical protein